MSELVSHKGRVVEVRENLILVDIVSESACASCHAAGLCGISESKKKTVEVPVRDTSAFIVGQEVEVCLAKKAGLKAVAFSYALPALILMILILSLSKIGFGELATGALTLAGVALYYFILYLFRDRLAEGYEFYIKRS